MSGDAKFNNAHRSLSERDHSVENGVVDDDDANFNNNTNKIPSPGMMSLCTEERKAASRAQRKAKRNNRQLSKSFSCGDEFNNVVYNDFVKTSDSWVKNSRKPRNGYGRGLPKKGGAGGKGVWGTPGDELYEDGSSRDSNDPNYDSETVDEYIVEKIEPVISEDEFGELLEPILLEYFEHGEYKEVQAYLKNVNAPNLKHQVVEKAISLALDHKDCHRELASHLISESYCSLLTSDEIAKGFDSILTSLADLTIDIPEAPKLVGQFIARAVADDCLPPKFISGYKGNVECPQVIEALERANVLLHQSHSQVRLDHVWGSAGGIRPVKTLKKKMILLLKEYLSSGDIEEARHCLLELEVPHFHHEVVYEIAVIVIEESHRRTLDMMCELLHSFFKTGVISLDQIDQGMKRLFSMMPDLSLDVPAAYGILDMFGEALFKRGVLSSELYRQIPQRGRKRFVSEGDGGRIKNTLL